ncbi:hypothetical protein U1Q18_008932 [Sarracenia purpurea var. burkii]
MVPVWPVVPWGAVVMVSPFAVWGHFSLVLLSWVLPWPLIGAFSASFALFFCCYICSVLSWRWCWPWAGVIFFPFAAIFAMPSCYICSADFLPSAIFASGHLTLSEVAKAYVDEAYTITFPLHFGQVLMCTAFTYVQVLVFFPSFFMYIIHSILSMGLPSCHILVILLLLDARIALTGFLLCKPMLCYSNPSYCDCLYVLCESIEVC